MHILMLTNYLPPEIGPEVPSRGTSSYARSKLRAMKNTFAGRSPNRRMK